MTGVIRKAGDLTFKAFTLGLGVATIYLAGTFSVNVYRGLAWHNAQSGVFVSPYGVYLWFRFSKLMFCGLFGKFPAYKAENGELPDQKS